MRPFLYSSFDTAADRSIFTTDVVESPSDDVSTSSRQWSGLGTLSHSNTNATVLGAANHLLIESWIFGCCDRRWDLGQSYILAQHGSVGPSAGPGT